MALNYASDVVSVNREGVHALRTLPQLSRQSLQQLQAQRKLSASSDVSHHRSPRPTGICRAGICSYGYQVSDWLLRYSITSSLIHSGSLLTPYGAAPTHFCLSETWSTWPAPYDSRRGWPSPADLELTG